MWLASGKLGAQKIDCDVSLQLGAMKDATWTACNYYGEN